MMRTSLALGLAVVAPVLCGCNGSLSLSEAPESPAPAPRVGDPDVTAKTSLRLVRDRAEFAVGESIDDMYQVFPNPKAAFEFNDLPPGFEQPYSAKGWEVAREGVGAILFNDKVVAVMRQLTRASSDQLGQIVETTRQANPAVTPEVIQGSRVVYYFWEQPPQRIMISGLNTRNDGWHITEALGDDTVMDAVGANPEKARANVALIDAKLASPKG